MRMNLTTRIFLYLNGFKFYLLNILILFYKIILSCNSLANNK